MHNEAGDHNIVAGLNKSTRGNIRKPAAGTVIQVVCFDERIAGPGIKGEERSIRADPGDVADPADIEESQWQHFKARGQRPVIDRYQGSTPTAGSDVIGAQIMDDPGLEAARQQRTVTQLKP